MAKNSNAPDEYKDAIYVPDVEDRQTTSSSAKKKAPRSKPAAKINIPDVEEDRQTTSSPEKKKDSPKSSTPRPGIFIPPWDPNPVYDKPSTDPPKDNGDEKAKLQQYVDFIDGMVTNGSESGLYSTVKQDAEKTDITEVTDHDNQPVIDKLLEKIKETRDQLARVKPDYALCHKLLSEVYHIHTKFVNAKTNYWRFSNIYGGWIWIYLTTMLVLVTVFYFIPKDSIIIIEPTTVDSSNMTNQIFGNQQTIRITNSQVFGNQQTIRIFDSSIINKTLEDNQETQDNGVFKVEKNFVDAVILGMVGAILQGYMKLWVNVNRYTLRKVWKVNFVSSPFIGAIIGAIIYLIVKAGLIVGFEGADVQPTNSLVFLIPAVIAGYNWQWFDQQVRRIADTIGGAKPEKK